MLNSNISLVMRLHSDPLGQALGAVQHSIDIITLYPLCQPALTNAGVCMHACHSMDKTLNDFVLHTL